MNERLAAPKEMKKIMLRNIRTALLELGSATKAELSGKLGFSFPTVSKLLKQMEKDGELLLVGLDDSSGGRRAARYAYNPEFMLGLAIFLEQTETNYTIFNCRGEVKEQGRTSSVRIGDFPSLTKHIEGIIDNYPKISSMAIGVPGAVNKGRIIYIPSHEQLQQFDLKGYFEERLSIPVVVENDMNAAVLGYNANRPNKVHTSLVYLYLGHNGPGAGIMINGDVVRGSTFFSGEVSFVPQYDERNFLQALHHGSGTEPPDPRDGKVIDAISRLVASFTAILNPHTIIFCNEELNLSMVDQVVRRSAAYIPEEHLPRLTTSDWEHDYLVGLQNLGLDLMIAETRI